MMLMMKSLLNFTETMVTHRLYQVVISSKSINRNKDLYHISNSRINERKYIP